MSKAMPRHGTRSRYRRYNCRCIGCQKGSHNQPIPNELRWPFRPLEKKMGKELIAAWFEPEQIKEWKENGLTDPEADRVAIAVGGMPHEIWGGWLEAGLDSLEYP